jgi:hypothetical protein
MVLDIFGVHQQLHGQQLERETQILESFPSPL